MIYRRNIDLPESLRPTEPPEVIKNMLETHVQRILAGDLKQVLKDRFHLLFTRLTKLDRTIYRKIFQKWEVAVTPNWEDDFLVTLSLILKEGEDIIQLISNPHILYTFNEMGRIATQIVEEITDITLNWEMDIDDEAEELHIYIGPA